MENINFLSICKMITLQGTNISHLGKRKIIFKMPFLGDMLVSWRVDGFFQLASISSESHWFWKEWKRRWISGALVLEGVSSHGVAGRRLVVVGRCEQILTLTVPILSLNCLFWSFRISVGYVVYFSVAVLFQVSCIISILCETHQEWSWSTDFHKEKRNCRCDCRAVPHVRHLWKIQLEDAMNVYDKFCS